MNFILGLILLLGAWIVNSPEAEAKCLCQASMCTQSSNAQKSFLELKRDLRKLHYPERLVQLAHRLHPQCSACLDKVPREFRLRVVDNQGRAFSKTWTPPTERYYRRQMKKGNIKAFYIYLNSGKRCECCGTKKYFEWPDFDENLKLNRNGPVIIYESLANVGGSDPGRWGDESSHHYAPRKTPYPPAQSLSPPKPPRIYHSKCARCAQATENLNSMRTQKYGILQEIYSLEKDIDIDQRVVAGLQHHIVDLFKNDRLSEADFFAELKLLKERRQLFMSDMEVKQQRVVELRLKLNLVETDLPETEGKIKLCEESLACSKPKPTITEPKAIQDISCNNISEEEFKNQNLEPHLKDLKKLNIHLFKIRDQWVGCKKRFDCPFINCRKSLKTRQSLFRLEKRISDLRPWLNKQLKVYDKYASTLNQMHITSTKNLNAKVFAQKVQSTLTDASSNAIFARNIFKDFKQILKKRSPANQAGRINEQAMARAKLRDVRKSMDRAITYISALNNLTKDVQFPLTEGKGIPGIRSLNNNTVAALTCAIALSNEFKILEKEINNKNPGWKANLLAYVAKGLQCFSTFQMVQRDQVIAELKRDLELEEQGLKRAMFNLKCVSQRKLFLDQSLRALKPINRAADDCSSGQCGRLLDSGTPIGSDVKSYGQAISLVEPKIEFHIEQLLSESQAHGQSIDYSESPPAKIELAQNSILPQQKFQVNYEVPWCKTQGSWMILRKSDLATDIQSGFDLPGGYYTPMLRQHRGQFIYRAPKNPGKYQLRIYDNWREGKTLGVKEFQVVNNLGALQSRSDFVNEYRGTLPDNSSAREMPKKPLAAGTGRVVFDTVNALNEHHWKHVDVFSGDQRVFSGRGDYVDLPAGQYKAVFSGYWPKTSRSFEIVQGHITVVRVSKQGRLRIQGYDALQKPLSTYAYIRDPRTKAVVAQHWIGEIDLAPGRYDIHISSYTPHIVKQQVEIKAGEITTLVTGGYGRIVFEPRDEKGKLIRSFKYVYRADSNSEVHQGWQPYVDLPPGVYRLKMGGYSPDYEIHNFVVTSGKSATASLRKRPARVSFLSTDGEKRFWLQIYKVFNGKTTRVHQGWFTDSETSVLLQEGLYRIFHAKERGKPQTYSSFALRSGENVRVQIPTKK